MLEELQVKALRDPVLRRKIQDTRLTESPIRSFCQVCQVNGYEIYPMELIAAGEEFYASYRRSTNGGGENSPKLKGQDDFYEMFLAALETKDSPTLQASAEQSDYNW